MKPSSFASILRQSQFIKLGDFRGAIVDGKIAHVTDQDLYIDFGSKFLAVTRKPETDQRLYVRGAQVKIKLHDYEVSDRFIGSKNETSLLEASASIVELTSSPVGRKQTNKN